MAVVESNVFAEMEDVRERVGRVPGFGEIAVESHLRVAFQQTVEEQRVDALGVRVCGVSRVEVGWIRLD